MLAAGGGALRRVSTLGDAPLAAAVSCRRAGALSAIVAPPTSTALPSATALPSKALPPTAAPLAAAPLAAAPLATAPHATPPLATTPPLAASPPLAEGPTVVAGPASDMAEEAGRAEAGGDPRKASRLPRASGRERCHSAGPRPSNCSSARALSTGWFSCAVPAGGRGRRGGGDGRGEGGVGVTPQKVDGPAQPQARQRAQPLGPGGEFSRRQAPLRAAAAVDAHVRKRRRGHGHGHRQPATVGRRRRGGGTRRAGLPLRHLEARAGVASEGGGDGGGGSGGGRVVGWVALPVGCGGQGGEAAVATRRWRRTSASSSSTITRPTPRPRSHAVVCANRSAASQPR